VYDVTSHETPARRARDMSDELTDNKTDS